MASVTETLKSDQILGQRIYQKFLLRIHIFFNVAIARSVPK